MSASSSRAWAITWLILGLLLVVRTGIRDRGVITDHLEFGHRVLHGEDLYAPFEDGDRPLHAPYPPGFGLLTAPFSVLPERLARWCWGLLQVGALAAIGAWLLGAIRRHAPGANPHLVLAATAVVTARYILRDTHGGGGNLINLALVLGCFAGAERGRSTAAGLALGFSIATKPTAVLMIPLLWLLGFRRAALIAPLAALVWTGIALLSLGQGLAPLQHWADGSLAYATMRDLFAEPAFGFPPFSWMNQSLRCAVARYVGVVPEAISAPVAHYFPGLGWSQGVTLGVRTAISAALLVATGLAVRNAATRPARDHAIAATLTLSLLLSPISWKAHHVALIPAFALLLCMGMRGEPGSGPTVRQRRRWPWALAAVYFVVCGIGEELTGKALKNTQQSLYVFTAGSLLLWGLSLRATRWHGSTASANVPRLAGGPHGAARQAPP